MKNANFAVYELPIGYVRIEHRGSRLTMLRLGLREDDIVDKGASDEFTDKVLCQLEEYLEGRRRSFDIELDLDGCRCFQKEVLKELLNIPYGETRTYGQIAEAIGNPKASRAVGGSNNRNPIHIIIPCHRVIGANGKPTGYAAGMEIKELLLNLEKENK